MLLVDVLAYMTIDGHKSNAFGVFIYMHHFFPLGPTLYVLVVEGFSYFLVHSMHQGIVKGIALPDSSS